MKRITNVKVITTTDDDPDLSFLGEFSRKPLYRHKNEAWIPTDPDNMKHTIWFSPCNHLPHKEENWRHVSEEDKQQVIKEFGSLRKADIHYAYEDMRRLQAYENGKWYMEIIALVVTIQVSEDGTHWATQDLIESIGGIESDGDDEYKNTIINEMKEEMKSQLKSWGFDDDEITNALNREWAK